MNKQCLKSNCTRVCLHNEITFLDRLLYDVAKIRTSSFLSTYDIICSLKKNSTGSTKNAADISKIIMWSIRWSHIYCM